jgi:triacylglycerol lipase
MDGARVDDDLVDALASAWGLRFNELADDSHVRDALFGISERRADGFAAENPDDPRVYYQSWAGVSSPLGLKNPKDRGACDDEALGDFRKADRMNGTLIPMAAIVARGTKLVPNDGMVTVESAKWGEFRGCIPADHLDEVGQTKHDRADARTGFDHVRFYRNLAFELAAMGY